MNRGADLLVQSLARAGVDTIYSLSGNQIMPVYDACLSAGIEIIHTRHEAAAVFMAEAHAQLTGGVGVALVTAAPGAANAIGPLYTARQSESAVLLLTGDSPLALDGRGAFQEMDQVAMSAPLTKASRRAMRAEDLGEGLADLIRLSLSGRAGPVHMALPFDVLEADSGDATAPEAAAFRPEPPAMPPADAEAIIAALRAARRPLVITGPSLSETRRGSLTRDLAEALDAPVIVMESPRGLRDPALGDVALSFAKADLVVSLGKPVDFTSNFGRGAPKARWIVVDPDAGARERAARNLGEALEATFDAWPAVAAATLMERAGQEDVTAGPNRHGWCTEVAMKCAGRHEPEGAEGAEEDNAQAASDSDGEGQPIRPDALVEAVQRRLEAAPRSVVICDGGEFGQWAQAGAHGDERLLNGPAGAIGGGLCYGVAAARVRPGALVVAFMGDGSSGFHLAEFETALRARTPFVAVIGNDARWNAEYQIQLREYGERRAVGCTLDPTRYDPAVAGLGGHGEYVTRLEDLDAALSRAVDSGRVACVNVMIEGLPAPAGAGH